MQGFSKFTYRQRAEVVLAAVRLYGLLLRVLERIRDSPDDAKLRSISATAKSLRSDVLEVDGGPELLQWAGFQPVGDRFQADAAALGPELAASRHAELQAHALQERDANFRRERDARIEAERQRRLPTGDTGPPLRRWGGRLPRFGRGARSFANCGLQCSKISTRIELQADPDNPRGLKPLDVSCMLEEGAKQNGTTYELYAVVQHLGATPFCGHYVAYCWHPPSCSWWCFDDSSVRRVDASRIGDEALNDGAYVLFLEKSKMHEEATAVS
ncbi:Usp2 [Symbiodinium sp. CCMP2592]|nr:Usp2 [Symbiodinium sp. CCMP2592]